MTDIIKMQRKRSQMIKDFLFFPLRALFIHENDRFTLSSLRTERFEYVAKEVKGYCLDVGCGSRNIFVKHFLSGRGEGIDIYPYEGLTKKQIVQDLSKFPFESNSFDSLTFIANINHIPKPLRDKELSEAYRCLKKNGNIIVTMGHPLAELLVHFLVFLYSWIFGQKGMDIQRGMTKDEEYYLTDKEILKLLKRASFKKIYKKKITTQWGLNQLFVGWKN